MAGLTGGVMVRFRPMKACFYTLVFPLLITSAMACAEAGQSAGSGTTADGDATTGADGIEASDSTDGTDASDSADGTDQTESGDSTDGGIQKGGAYYILTVTLPSGLQQKFEKQLDDKQTSIAFGSSHIAPAVSLQVEDQFLKPFATVTMSFGFVVGSNDYKVTIAEEGMWEWGQGDVNTPPGVKIETKDQGKPVKLVSWEPEADGSYLITKWGTGPDEIVQGKIQGKLVDTLAKANGNTDNMMAEIEGEFRLLLPEVNLGN